MNNIQIQNNYPFVISPSTESSHSDSTYEHEHEHASINDDEAYWLQRTRVIEELLERKGYFTAEDVRREIEREDSVTPMLGARLVARAWVDPEFKQRLLTDGKAACREMDIDTAEIKRLQVVENTDTVHHVIVCTLCSCYPRAILGYHPPSWYKSTAYRNRVVVDPRGVLREEFGTLVPNEVQLKVMDSNADTRYLVIPKRPTGTEDWSEEELLRLVTRDSMVGVAFAEDPSQVNLG
ncbi:nitrile hydratase subunit alpha [Leptolyngbya sp. GB1-A1]|uniref:nitrile hydratase subunit alpha n=1 Tax=Leptolyngbya sp. GB1-A1 TaxID=2933908 RepID=UPI003298DA7E